MQTPSTSETERLLRSAQDGNASAVQQLMATHRDHLKHLVQIRLDRRLAARVDASDVVQDAMADAMRRMPDYLEGGDLPFYPWIRQITLDRIARLCRTHLGTEKRNVSKEEPVNFEWNDDSVVQLANRFAAKVATPSAQAMRTEMHALTRTALTSLSGDDQDLLAMKYLEQLTLREIASALQLSEAAVKSRHLRALGRLSQAMKRLGVES